MGPASTSPRLWLLMRSAATTLVLGTLQARRCALLQQLQLHSIHPVDQRPWTRWPARSGSRARLAQYLRSRVKLRNQHAVHPRALQLQGGAGLLLGSK